MIWLGRGDEKRSVLTWKHGYDYCLMVQFPQEKVLILIVATFLNAKARNRTTKQVDSKTNRMVMIGLYSKGTDGQMYTSSFILCKKNTTYF